MKKYLKDYVFLFIVAGAIVLVDQWTKSMVRANLNFYATYPPADHWLTQYARIIHIQNTGAAFGMFERFGGFFTILSFVVGIFILYYFPQITHSDRILRVALSMQFAGAVGNLLDRLFHGYVTDFISIDSLPVFNLADLSISSGVAILVIVMWYRDRRKKTPENPADVTMPASSNDISGE